MEDKKCVKCGLLKMQYEFWKSNKTKDGYDTVCRECRLAYRDKYDQSPIGIYSLQARTLCTMYRHIWFPAIKDGYHLDHRVSIATGFRAGVELKYIASRQNLMPVEATKNRKKSDNNSISVGQLMRSYMPDASYEHQVNWIEEIKDVEHLKKISRFCWEYNRQYSIKSESEKNYANRN